MRTTRRHRPTLHAIACGAALLAAAAGPAHAADRYWVCTGVQNFNYGNCWKSGLGPVNGDNAYFIVGTSDTAMIDFPGTTGTSLSLTNVVVDGGKPVNPVQFVVDSSGTLHTATTIIGASNNAILTVAGYGSSPAFLTASTLQFGHSAGSLGMMYVDGPVAHVVAVNLQVGADGSGQVIQSGGLVEATTLAINASSSYLVGGGTLNTYSQFSNAGGLSLNGGTLAAYSGLTNYNTFNLNGGSVWIQGTLTNASSGTLNVASSQNIFGKLSNSGVIALSSGRTLSGASLTNQSTGRIVLNGSAGLGNLTGNAGLVTVNNDLTVTNNVVSLANSGRIALAGKTLSVNTGIANTGLIGGYGTIDAAVQNSGNVVIGAAQTIEFKQGLTNASSGQIQLQGVDGGTGPNAALGNGGNATATLANSGLLGGAGYVYTQVRNDGRVVAGANADLVFIGSYYGTASSVQRGGDGGRLFFYGPATFASGATVAGPYEMFTNQLEIGDPGTAGRLTLQGQAWLNNATLTEDVFGMRPASHDLLTADTLNIIGTSTLRLTSGSSVLQAGQRIDVLDWTALNGSFATIDTSSLQLASGATLDTSRLYVDGTIGVIAAANISAVPEPAAWMLLVPGMLLVARAASRSSAMRRG